ncbi:MAG: DUF2834 domain-containing protein [Moorea sp. SIO2B7]|nr:DUF2834 domain-containing protein [Moorena sp. SIO2B7]
MVRTIGVGLLWIGFISYAFLLAPPTQPDTFELIKNLSTGQLENINPLIIALFNLMGILPLIYGCVLFIDGRGQKIPAWPFAIGTFALGGFVLLPYLALRESNPKFTGEKGWFLKLQDSRLFGILITLGALILLSVGIVNIFNGNWADFVEQWQTSRFIHVMSLDFCVLCLVFPALLKDDMARRGVKNSLVFWGVSLIPLLGALAYLCLRPSLPDNIYSDSQSDKVANLNILGNKQY